MRSSPHVAFIDAVVKGSEEEGIKFLEQYSLNQSVLDEALDKITNIEMKKFTDAHLRIVEHLINAGANVNVKDKHGSVPLHTAAAHGNEKLVNLLLEKGADIMIIDDRPMPAFMFAATWEHFKLAKFLYDKMYEINPELTKKAAKDVFFREANRGHIEGLKFLLENKLVDVNSLYKITLDELKENSTNMEADNFMEEEENRREFEIADGATALHLAVLNEDESEALEVINYLLEKGADLTIKNTHKQQTAYDLAKEEGRSEEILNLLDINKKQEKKQSAQQTENKEKDKQELKKEKNSSSMDQSTYEKVYRRISHLASILGIKVENQSTAEPSIKPKEVDLSQKASNELKQEVEESFQNVWEQTYVPNDGKTEYHSSQTPAQLMGEYGIHPDVPNGLKQEVEKSFQNNQPQTYATPDLESLKEVTGQIKKFSNRGGCN